MGKKVIWEAILTVVLAVACVIAAAVPSVRRVSFSGWTGEQSIRMQSFFTNVFLVCGGIEAVLGFIKGILPRILGIVVAAAKLVIPWLSLYMLDMMGVIMTDVSVSYSITNPAPFVCGALCVGSGVVQLVRLCRKTRKER